MRTVAFHWSGGKDSALALTALLDDESVVVDRLVTTVLRESSASTVHEIPVDLLQAQADSIGLPLQTVVIPGPGLGGYVEAMDAAATRMRREGIDTFAFGDLCASGVLDHKVAQFAPLGIEVLEPLWGLTSHECVERFLASGIRAVTVVVDAAVLGPDGLGVGLDHDFFADLPAGVDPCGELGEFHSFAHDGPLFRRPVDFELTAPRRFEQEIGTTDGMRTYTYWLATPRGRR
ncbi:hypothetical protein [Janibacter alittae]|uniref:Diphthamide synthase domain-containing protein n=1 Tax=Janibacter alittae TaxID=3115209 RepID=A0ABZ2MGE6_9MICO